MSLRSPRSAAPTNVPLRLGRPAGLDADRAAVVEDQLVLRVDLEGPALLVLLGHLAGELRLDRRRVGLEVGSLQRGARDQGEVVRRGELVRRVEPARVDGGRVARTELAGSGVHRRHGLGHPAGGVGQGVRGVVAGHEEQALEQAVTRVGRVGDHAHLAALDVRVLPDSGVDGVGVELGQQRQRGQHLQRAGRTQPAVRVAGREHLAGVQVGEDVGARREPRERLDHGSGGRRPRWRAAPEHRPGRSEWPQSGGARAESHGSWRLSVEGARLGQVTRPSDRSVRPRT